MLDHTFVQMYRTRINGNIGNNNNNNNNKKNISNQNANDFGTKTC